MKEFLDQRTLVALIAVVIVTGWIWVSSLTKAGWRSAAVLSYGMYAALVGYAIWAKDAVFGAALAFALVAGFTELLADRWLVRRTGKLHYMRDEPMIVASPLYMPFSWAVILTLFYLIGYRITELAGMGWGMAAAGLGGGLLIPFFEHCAKGARWWSYSDWKHQWWDTPYFIMLGEALLAASLPLFIPYLAKPLHISVLLCGIAEGLWIWAAYWLAYRLLK